MHRSVYAFGSNGSGQLGIGHCDDVAKPTPVIFDHSSPQPADAVAVKIVAGGNHTLLRFSSGAVYAAGSNEDGRCGLPVSDAKGLSADEDSKTAHVPESVDNKCFTTFRRVRFICHPASATGGKEEVVDRFLDISATWSASFFLTSSGEVYAAGTGYKGELGLGYMPQSASVSQASDTSSEILITHAATPMRLSIPPSQSSSSQVESSESAAYNDSDTIVSLVSGVNHTIATTSQGQTYGWGNGRHGELGTPKQNIIALPRHIPEFDRRPHDGAMVGMLAGLNWSYALNGPRLEETSHNSEKANQKMVQEKDDYPYRHVLLGSSQTHPLQTIALLTTLASPTVNIDNNWQSLHILFPPEAPFSIPQIHSFGRNNRGQFAPQNIVDGTVGGGIEVLVAGSEHCLAKCRDGVCRAWGWGEHGNCGEYSRSGEDHAVGVSKDSADVYEVIGEKWQGKAGEWNEIWIEVEGHRGRCRPLGAGCATSFVIADA